MRVDTEPLPVIRIDQADAVELIELLEFTGAWLAGAGPAVYEDFGRFVDGPYLLGDLRTDLLAWAARLSSAPSRPR